jgi:hypothetical protein
MPIIIDPFIHNNIKCKSPPICIYCINTKKISKCLYNCGALLTENSFKHNFLLTSKIDIFLNKYINMFKNIFNEELNIFLCFKCNSKFDKLQLLYDHIVYYLNNKKCIKKNNICKECNWRTINIINNVHDNNSKIFYHKHLCSRCNIKNNL